MAETRRHTSFTYACFGQATRDDVLDALDVLDADRRSSRPPNRGREEESKGNGEAGSTSGVDLVAFIRLMRQRPTQAQGSIRGIGPTAFTSPTESSKVNAELDLLIIFLGDIASGKPRQNCCCEENDSTQICVGPSRGMQPPLQILLNPSFRHIKCMQLLC